MDGAASDGFRATDCHAGVSLPINLKKRRKKRHALYSLFVRSARDAGDSSHAPRTDELNIWSARARQSAVSFRKTNSTARSAFSLLMQLHQRAARGADLHEDRRVFPASSQPPCRNQCKHRLHVLKQSPARSVGVTYLHRTSR